MREQFSISYLSSDRSLVNNYLLIERRLSSAIAAAHLIVLYTILLHSNCVAICGQFSCHCPFHMNTKKKNQMQEQTEKNVANIAGVDTNNYFIVVALRL